MDRGEPPPNPESGWARTLRGLRRYNSIGVGLRGLSMLGKFLLLTWITKELPLEDLGIYGLFLTSVVLVGNLLGFELHTYTTRELLGTPPERRAGLLLQQALMHSVPYLLVLPALLVIFSSGVLPWTLLVHFYWVVICVHIGQETHRLLIVLSRPTAAYAVSFLLHGVWTFAAILFLWYSPESRGLEVVFAFWGASATLGALFGLTLLGRMGLLRWRGFAYDGAWMRRGVAVSFRFFVGVVAFRIIDLSDRYFIEHFRGKAEVGIYTLYGSVANIAQEVAFAGVAALAFPAMIAHLKKGEVSGYQIRLRRFRREILGLSAFLVVALIAAMFALVAFLGREELRSHLPAFFLLLASTTALNLSMIPHYALYAHDRDELILKSVLVGVVMNLALNWILIPDYGLWGAAVATLASFTVVGALKWWFARTCLPAADQGPGEAPEGA